MRVAVLGLAAQLASMPPGDVAGAGDTASTTQTTTLRWTAPEGCPSAIEVAGWLDDAPGGAPITAAITVRRIGPSRWEVEVTVGEPGEGSRRTIAGESCVAVTRAAVVVVALAQGAAPAEPTTPEPPPPPPPSPRVEPVTEPTPPRSAAVVPSAPAETPTSTRAPFGLRLAAAPLIGAGPLPRIAGGVHGGIGIEARRWWFEVGASHWFRSFAARRATPSAGVAVALTTATLDLGPRFAWRRLAIVLGGVAELGVLAARPVNTERRGPDRRAWIAAGGRAGVHWRVRPWLGFGLEAAVVAPMIRGRYVVGGTEVHRVGPVAAQGAAVVHVVLPVRAGRLRS